MGSQLLQVVVQLLGDVLEVDDGLDVNLLLGLLGHDVGADIFLEAATELRDVLGTQRQAHGIGMSAEVLEQVTAALDGIVDVVAGNAAGRAGGHSVLAGEYYRGTEVHLGEARGNDAYNALLPALVVEHDGRLVLLALEALDDLVGLLAHLLVNVLALLVVFVDVHRCL